MKRICSLLLSVAILATMVFCPTAGILASAAASAVKPNGVIIENTFDEEGWNPLANSNLIKEEITPPECLREELLPKTLRKGR